MKIKRCFNLVLVLTGMVVFICLLCFYHARHQARSFRRDSELQASREFHGNVAPRLVPMDESAWLRRYAKEEVALSKTELQEWIEKDHAQLPEVRKRFCDILTGVPYACTNGTVGTVSELLARIEEVMNVQRSHVGRRELLHSLLGQGWKSRLSLNWFESCPEQDRSLALRRWYEIRCQLADWLWSKGNAAVDAAEMDVQTYSLLRRFSDKSWLAAEGEPRKTVNTLIESWKDVRCDQPDSNLHRAHLVGEEFYRSFFQSRVENGDTNLIKTINRHYRYHLSIARNILGREPQWMTRELSPNQSH